MISAAAWRRCAIAFLTGRAAKTARRRARSFIVQTNERLEPKLVMSALAAVPGIQMLSATTTDSESVTIQYQVNDPPDATSPIQIGIFRSANGQFDSSDSLVDEVTLAGPGSTSGQARSPSTRAVNLPPRPARTSSPFLCPEACRHSRRSPTCSRWLTPARPPRPPIPRKRHRFVSIRLAS